MREILFRAKRQDNDEFVEGYLISENYIRLHIGVYHNEEYICDRTEDYPVKPETVGQFTGLTDKNGKKVFEGDIVKVSIYYDCGCYPHSETEIRQVKNLQDVYVWNYDSIEVIGDIYDNPELLGD